MFDFNYNPIGKTLAEVAKETKPDHYNGYSVFVLENPKDTTGGKEIATAYSVKAILEKHPEYSDYIVKKTNDFCGTTVLRVMKKQNKGAKNNMNMTPQEALEIITNAIQTENMTAEQDKALALAQKALKKQTPIGEWKVVYRNKVAAVYECSNCGHLQFGTSDYCICGTKMNEKDDAK